MKTRGKLRQRRLALDMAVILHPVDYQRAKELFRIMINSLVNQK